jgi:transposase
VRKEGKLTSRSLTAEQRVLTLDAWLRSGLPAKDFAPLVGVSHHTLYNWKRRFTELGPAGLEEGQRGRPRGSRLPDVTKRAILLMKETNPDWGCQRISDVLYRGSGYPASPTAVGRVLKEAGYELEDIPTTPHRDKVRRFERTKPGQLWQTDLFTFVLKRQNRRVHLVVFLDDHSRFIVSHGIAVSATTEMVRETLRRGITGRHTGRHSRLKVWWDQELSGASGALSGG